jgi:hypothetical protein
MACRPVSHSSVATVAVETEKGQAPRGTVTDYNGRFSLSVPQTAGILTVRYLGYVTQTIHLEAGKADYQVTLMPEEKSIGEVVVTGYQKIDRRKLTAAVSTLNVTDETVGAVKNIDQALAGQIAGLSTISSSVLRVLR